MTETIVIASDHAGYELKAALVPLLRERGLEVLDLGPEDRQPVDYPDMAKVLAQAVGRGEAGRGILICGSGIGISIAANRHSWIRAALCHDGLSARLARQHNDANVLVLGGRLIGVEVAKDCVDQFLSTPFEGGRHSARVAKLG